MKKIILTALASIGLCLGAPAAAIITQWNFNSNPYDGNGATGTLVPSTGSGTATTVGTVSTTFNTSAGSSDPLGSDTDNSAWRMSANWPAQGTGNKTCGVQLNISTVGSQNITLTWDLANSATANKYYRVQYSIDNGATWVDKDVIVNNTGGIAWNTPIATVSFAAIPGANNNSNFGVRIMSEFQSTAVGGTAGYVAAGGGSYATGGVLRLDMVTFNGDAATGGVTIITNPTNQVVAIGQPASFNVVAGGGSTPFTYQWRKTGSPIGNATNSILAFLAAQTNDAASYDVIVSNGVNSQTSAVAVLTVRTPLNLAWTGLNGATWDTATVSWIDTASNNLPYTGGDNVLFDSRGFSAPTVSLIGSINPSSVIVDADFNYLLRSDAGGLIAGNSGLTKRGLGTLTLDTDNSYSGPTVIQAGVVQLGVADAHGSPGSGPITNNGALVFNRTDTFILANTITGSGGITNIGKTVTLTGSNVYNGPIYAASGSLGLSSNQVVNSTDWTIAASSATGINGATKLVISDGLTVGSGTTLHFTGSTASPDTRCTFSSSSGTNTFNGPILLAGAGANNLSADGAATELRINGNISGPSFALGASFFLRGNLGSGVLNGTINLPNNVVNKTDSGNWTINSTGNSWGASVLAVGTLRIGVDNALPTAGMTLYIGQASSVAMFDLAGHNQQLAVLLDSLGTLGTEIITNSSATADSTLTIGAGMFSGTIADSAAGHKTSLTLNGGFTLAGFNTYSGDTTVLAGTLTISGAGDIPNSANINLAGGGMDVSGRYDQTLPLIGTQTLKGNGTMAITGNLANNGTIELKVNKAGSNIIHDQVSVTGQFSSGGTLKLDLTGQALNWKDVIPVFAAGSYAGSIPVITPAVPAPGAVWDTSTLLSDGVLRVYGPPTVTSTVLSGGNITLNGLGGPAFGSFSVLSTTNLASPGAWPALQAGSFDGSGNFSITLAITPGQPQQFFKLQIP